MEVYLDNAATTPALPEVADAVRDALLSRYANPSSAHRWGIAADQVVAGARRAIAGPLGADGEEILFTSGGTEANNLAVLGLGRARRRDPRRAVTTTIEHSSLLGALQTLEEQGWDVIRLSVDRHGRIDPAEVAAAAGGAALVAIGHVNNEVGTVQPVEAVGAALQRLRPRPAFHLDAVQSFGKVPLKPREWGVDTCALSAHKIHGPKGVGALWVRRGTRLQPLLRGGDQQGGLRPGTENVPGIAGFGAAARGCAADPEAPQRMAALKRRLWTALAKGLPRASVNGPEVGEGAPHILNVRLGDIPAELLLHALEERGVACSAGSACHARRPEPSHVLLGLGLPAAQIGGSVRLSLSRLTTAAEIDAAAAAAVNAAASLQRLVRR